MPRNWETVDSEYILKKPWMKLRMDHVRLPSGTELPEFHVLEYPDFSAVICIREDGRYVLVDQYRHGVLRRSLEFASGAIDPGEDPETGARRELLEETGYVADELVFLGAVAPDPSKHTNYAHLYVARNARKVAEPTPDDGEDIRVVILTREELNQAIDSNRIIHSAHVAGIWLAERRGLLD